MTHGLPGIIGVVTQHLVVKAEEFGSSRFWDALSRLADREGHEGHQRFMVGSGHRLNWYAYQCSTCSTTVAEFVIDPGSDADMPAVGAAPREDGVPG